MNTAYLILGSNKGDKLQNLQQAIHLIEKEIGSIIKISDTYSTAAWGDTSQPDFLNQAICIQTFLSPTNVLQGALEIEKKLGRIRDQEKWKERIIDIDILFYDNIIIDTPDLKIPHPYIQERKFVLVPLLEIASTFIHPIFHKTIETLLKECTDTLEVQKISS